tara:strand:+ start:7831 stop:8340 length:510 start_codon:yes stop_codon:yes gene_type:complete
MEIKSYMDNISFSIKGIFLLLLTLSSKYFTKYLGFNFHSILNKAPLMKNVLLFSFIYFAITLTSTEKNSKELHPLILLRLSFGIYIFFILFGKMEYYCTLITVILLLSAYVNYTFYRYYKKNNKIEEFKKLKKIQNVIYTFIIVTLVVGISLKYNKHKNESIIKYLFEI